MALADLVYASPFYRFLLAGSAPTKFRFFPPAPWPGDRSHGDSILSGTLRCCGEPIEISAINWADQHLNPRVRDELHGFAWLGDVAAIGTDRAHELARRLIGSWVEHHAHWDAAIWAPETLGRRVANWLSNAKSINLGSGNPSDRPIIRSLTQQLRHLARIADRGPDGLARLSALRGWIYGAACGLTRARHLEAALRALSREIKRQVLADGGHAGRSPALQLAALGCLVDIRAMLVIAERPVPPDLQSTIEQMAPMVRFFRHGDGRFALFNGSQEGTRDLADAVLARADAGGRPAESAVHTGFERIAAGPALILIDTGSPPREEFNRLGHAGTLSFEMSCGRERLIVNCGAATFPDAAWENAQRATAAHSTLTVDDTNSSALEDGRAERVAQVICQRDVSDGNAWLSASHDGYQKNFGLLHQRRLYVSHDGNDVRGEDTLTGSHRGRFSIRFHLHPEVRASEVQSGFSVLMRQPSGTAWRLQASGARLELAESMYLGAGVRRRTAVAVLSGAVDGSGVQVKWAIKRVAGL